MIPPYDIPEPDSDNEQKRAAWDTYDRGGTLREILLYAQRLADDAHREVEQIRDRLTGRNSAAPFYVGYSMQKAASYSRMARRLYVRWCREGCPCP